MQTASTSEKRFTVSLSTKFILFTLFMEILLVVGGIYTAYIFISEQRVQHVQSMLASQVGLLTKAFESEKDKTEYDFNRLELNPDTAFQIIRIDGEVVWDSKNPKRVKSRLNGTHPLFDTAKSENAIRKTMSFRREGSNEVFFGSYRKIDNQYVVMGAISKTLVSEDTFYVLEKLLYLGGLLSGIALLLIVFFSYRISKPIQDLTIAARHIANGKFDYALTNSYSNDEIGLLSQAFTSMSQRVKALLQDEFHKVRIKAEVSNVAEIQKSLLPAPKIITDQYEIQSYYQSAAETGGDCWGYFSTKDFLVTYIADATGHGLTSAMLTVAARGCFATLHRLVEQEVFSANPSQFLSFANEAVLASAQEELNMTMFVAAYSYRDRTLTYANAGHNPGWIVRKRAEGASIEVLKGSGVRLGESSQYTPPENSTVSLGEDDVLFLYTDGLIDCENADQKQYGKNRLKDLLVEKLQTQKTLESVRNQVIADFTQFIEEEPIEDDITFALVRPK